jgi:hypothetical protein
MGYKQHEDQSVHQEPQNFMRPFDHISHNDFKGDAIDQWAHPDTRHYHGLDAPDAHPTTFLEAQRTHQGYPSTHKPVDTTLRFYTDQDVRRSCPSV